MNNNTVDIKAALRVFPDKLIIGESRDPEGIKEFIKSMDAMSKMKYPPTQPSTANTNQS